MPALIEARHISKRGDLLTIAIPENVREKFVIKRGEIVGFYDDDGELVIKFLK